MTRREIVSYFAPITPEEERILQGNRIDNTLYGEGDGSVVQAKKLLETGKLITMRTHTRFVSFPAHSHDFVEAVYMLKGETHHLIGESEVCLREGEILFLGMDTRHEILPASREDVALNFIILPAFFQKSLEMLGAEDTPVKGFLMDALFGQPGAGYLHFRASSIPSVQNLLENLILALLSDAPNKQSIARTTMALVFMELMNRMDTLSAPSPEDAILSEVYRYLEEHYRDGSLGELAKRLCMDSSCLSRLLCRQTGKNYTELVQEKRLSQAVYLLKNTRLPVEEIAVLSGYENKSYFYRLFLAEYQLTPGQFRKKGHPFP